MTSSRIRDDQASATDLGREASRPSEIPKRGWIAILKRTWTEGQRDNLGIVAAGVAFLTLLALFPAMSATVSIYGLVADPAEIPRQLAALSGILPGEALGILRGQLDQLAGQAGGALSLGLLLSLGLALWSAASGVKSVMSALNIVYEEEETRGFLAFTATALALTLGFILLLILLVAAVAVLPAIIGLFGLGRALEWTISLLRWPLVAGLVVLALAVLYRYGPSRAPARWRWLSWGAAAAALLWLLASIVFSIYIGNFADYNATYGSLGAAVVLLLWLYLGAYAVLLGAELDAEMEHHTVRDTTVGPERPMGQRSARMADTVATRP